MQLERILFDIGSAGERFLHGGAEARARDRVGIGIETGFGERRAPQRQAQVVVEQGESRARRQQQCEISPATAAEALCLRVRVIQQQIACGLSRVRENFGESFGKFLRFRFADVVDVASARVGECAQAVALFVAMRGDA